MQSDSEDITVVVKPFKLVVDVVDSDAHPVPNVVQINGCSSNVSNVSSSGEKDASLMASRKRIQKLLIENEELVTPRAGDKKVLMDTVGKQCSKKERIC